MLREIPFKGDLSAWIRRFENGHFAVGPLRVSGWRGLVKFCRCLKLLLTLCDPAKGKWLVGALASRISAKDADEMEAYLRDRNFAGFNERGRQMANKAGVEAEFNVLEIIWTLRAVQTACRCIALYGMRAHGLIDRARQGDRRAVLDLVKVDTLFLTDTCTQEVIKKAAAESDQSFMEQLARAEKYKALFRRRHACQIYLYCLFALGVKLPRIYNLQSILDPDGTEFPGGYGFERFVQRRRKELFGTSKGIQCAETPPNPFSTA